MYHPDAKHLLTIRPKTDDIYIEPSEDSQLWQVVRNSQDQGIGSLVREKDIIKLGKKTFLITKIKDSDEAGFHYKKNSKKISTLTATYISENNDIEENDERAN